MSLHTHIHTKRFLGHACMRPAVQTARQVDYLHNVIRDIPGAEEPLPLSHFEGSVAGSATPPEQAAPNGRGLKAMGTIARSSGMKALLAQQNHVGARAHACTCLCMCGEEGMCKVVCACVVCLF